jgi:hypothetical protein
MTTVAQLIEFLQTLPQDAEIDVMAEKENEVVYEELEIPDEFGNSSNLNVFDFSNNFFIRDGHELFGKVIVSFGG